MTTGTGGAPRVVLTQTTENCVRFNSLIGTIDDKSLYKKKTEQFMGVISTVFLQFCDLFCILSVYRKQNSVLH